MKYTAVSVANLTEKASLGKQEQNTTMFMVSGKKLVKCCQKSKARKKLPEWQMNG